MIPLAVDVQNLIAEVGRNVKLDPAYLQVIENGDIDIPSFLQGILDTTGTYKPEDRWGDAESQSYQAGNAWAIAVKDNITRGSDGLAFIRGVRDMRVLGPTENSLQYHMGAWAVANRDNFYQN